MEVFAVIWSSGSSDDHGIPHSFAGVHGVYKSKESAKTMLEVCKNAILSDIKNDLNPDGEYPDYEEEANIQVYGSVEQEYFEIDYTLGTEPVEVYIGINATRIED